MVGIGFALIGLSAWFWLTVWRKRGFASNRWLLRALAIAAPAGFIAIEAGWTVTEVGRQPWVIQGVMRTEDAVTTVPNQFVALGGFTFVYLVLAIALTWLLLRLARTPPMLTEPEADRGSRHAVD
jgi:cytochrome d ubiquinol oxidase subunit I